MKIFFENRREFLPWLIIPLGAVAVIAIIARITQPRQHSSGPEELSPASQAKPLLQPDHRQYYVSLPRFANRASPASVLTNACFIAGYYGASKIPAWVCYRLSRTSGLGATQAIGKCVMPDITPRNSKFNREVWDRIEAIERQDFPQRLDEIWVTAGPIYDDPSQRFLGQKDPDASFKVIVDEQDGQPRMLAFIIDQEVEGVDKLSLSLVTVDDVEQATGLDLFSDLPDELENRWEAETPFHLW